MVFKMFDLTILSDVKIMIFYNKRNLVMYNGRTLLYEFIYLALDVLKKYSKQINKYIPPLSQKSLYLPYEL